MITIATLRAAGLSAEQIVRVLEIEAQENLVEEAESLAAYRERKRINQQNHRSRNRVTGNIGDVTAVTAVTAVTGDTPSPLPPPSMVSPITPSLTTPPISPSEIYRSNAAFEAFWKAYPRRKGKKAAEKALTKALRETSIETILRALARQTPSWEDLEFAPFPATWLNQGRWADEPEGMSSAPANEFVPDPTMPTREELESRYAGRGPTTGPAAEGPGVLPKSKCLQNGETNGIGLGGSGEQAIRCVAGIFPQAGMETLRNSNGRAGGVEEDHNAD